MDAPDTCTNIQGKGAHALLNEALELGKQELAALMADDMERVEILAGQRSERTKQAWALRHDCDVALYKAKLLQLQSVQTRLRQEATKKQNDVRQGLLRSRKENKRQAGYKQAMTYNKA